MKPSKKSSILTFANCLLLQNFLYACIWLYLNQLFDHVITWSCHYVCMVCVYTQKSMSILSSNILWYSVYSKQLYWAVSTTLKLNSKCSFCPLWSVCEFCIHIHTAGHMCPSRSKSQIPATQKEAGLFRKDRTEREIATRIKPVLWKSGAAGRFYHR